MKNTSPVIQSSNEVITKKKGVIRGLGLRTPDLAEPLSADITILTEVKQETPAEPTPLIYKDDYSHPVNNLFITMNFPRNDKIRLNKKMNYKYKDYKTLEQRIIIKRIENLFKDLNIPYYIAFEYCRDMSLHCHCVVSTTMAPRDLTIEIKRFYGIAYDAFCVIKNLPSREDLIKVYDYINHKDVKTYQSTGFIPLQNNFDIKELISKYNI